MNKTDLIQAIAQTAGLSKKEATAALDATLAAITDALARREDVALIGFATLSISERPARTGRNPQTGQPMQIPATNVIKFKTGKELKKSIQ